MKAKKMTFSPLWGWVVAMTTMLMAVSCANGFDSDEKFESTVKNTALKSPDVAGITVTPTKNSKLENVLQVSWKVVNGAGGYLCNVTDVTDASAPNVIVADSIVDGVSFLFPYDEEEITTFDISIKTLGNQKLNNTEAETPTVKVYTMGGIRMTVPSSNKDLAKYIADYLEANKSELEEQRKDPNFEVAFDLEAGAQYTYDTEVDFGLQAVRIRCLDAENRPTIKITKPIETMAGLRLKNLNFDCTGSEITTIIALSDQPDASLSTEALGYKADGANQDGYVINRPIIVDNCMVKNLPKSLLYGQKISWSLREFRIVNSIIQLDNGSSDAPFMHLQGASNGLIKNLTISNSTIYNTKENGSAYFLRYSNSSNAQPKKIFGNSDDSVLFIFSNSTLAQVYTGKDFGNNIPDYNKTTHRLTNCIFYECFRLYQVFGRSSTIREVTDCVLSAPKKGVDSNDSSRFGVVEDDCGFKVPFAELDLTQPNGGVNFKATGALSSTIGDPRWR